MLGGKKQEADSYRIESADGSRPLYLEAFSAYLNSRVFVKETYLTVRLLARFSILNSGSQVTGPSVN